MKNRNFKFYFLWLSLICLIVFILQNVFAGFGFTESYILNSKAIDDFQIWRFVSAIFLHADVVHLIYNLFALLLFGFILEKLVGSKKFLFVFLVSGIVANIISVNFYDSSLGASGAIYGVLGAIILLRPMMMVWAFGIMMPMFIAGVLWIIGDVLGVFGFGSENIGNIAHLSGIGVGLLFGIWIRFFGKARARKDKKLEIPDDYVEKWEDRYM